MVDIVSIFVIIKYSTLKKTYVAVIAPRYSQILENGLACLVFKITDLRHRSVIAFGVWHTSKFIKRSLHTYKGRMIALKISKS